MRRTPALALLALALALASSAPAQQPASDVPVAGAEGVPVPKRTKSVLPEYPPAAQAQGVRGIVILQVLIDEQGKVAGVDVVRSIPGLDEAAVAAVRQWEYEPVKIGGKPSSVRLTVPITFLMKLPEVAREPGVPELRQGALPANPRPEGRASVTAQLTVDPDGQLVEAEIVKGESPFSEALLQALRTWAFVADAERGMIAFRLEAQFQPAERGRPAITFSAGGVRAASPAAEAPAPAEAQPEPSSSPAPPAMAPAPASPAPAASQEPASQEPASQEPAQQEPASQESAQQESAPRAAVPQTPAPQPAAPQPAAPPPATPPPAPPSSSAPPAPPATVASPSTPAASAASATPSGTPASAPQPPPNVAASPAPQAVPATAKPPVTEVLRAPTGAAPGVSNPAGAPQEGLQSTVQAVSAVRDVLLGPGVPELASGRRPVLPPLARLGGIRGLVIVRFSIDSGGGTQVAAVEGPKALEAAARQMVESWSFRRLRPDRLMAAAQVTYEAEGASALVNLEP